MAWTGQTFSVGQILTAAQMNNLQADITALANGDSGAPTIDPINAMDHLGAVGAVGTYAMLRRSTATTNSPGDAVAGSSLRYIGAMDFLDEGTGETWNATNGAAPSGTWRCMGSTSTDPGDVAGSARFLATLWLRIS